MDRCSISHKQRYANPDSAWKTLHLLNSPRALFTHKRKGKDGLVYRCPHCKDWHITGQHKKSPKVQDWKEKKRQLREDAAPFCTNGLMKMSLEARS